MSEAIRTKRACETLGSKSILYLADLAQQRGLDPHSSKKTLCALLAGQSQVVNIDDIPYDYIDPITGEPLIDAVVVSDGFSYNASTVNNILFKPPLNGISPRSGSRVNTIAIPNNILSRVVQNWLNEHGSTAAITTSKVRDILLSPLRIKKFDRLIVVPASKVHIDAGDINMNALSNNSKLSSFLSTGRLVQTPQWYNHKRELLRLSALTNEELSILIPSDESTRVDNIQTILRKVGDLILSEEYTVRRFTLPGTGKTDIGFWVVTGEYDIIFLLTANGVRPLPTSR